MEETTKPDERGWELTGLVIRSLALVQIGLVIGGLLAPVTETTNDDPRPLSAAGLFLALTNVQDPGDHSEDHLFALIVSGVTVLGLVGVGVVALLLIGSVWYPGRLPLLSYLLSGVVVLGTIALLGVANSISIERESSKEFTLVDGASGGPAWGLWVLIAAAGWAVNLGYGVKRLAK